jgi:hypothetical protein
MRWYILEIKWNYKQEKEKCDCAEPSYSPMCDPTLHKYPELQIAVYEALSNGIQTELP